MSRTPTDDRPLVSRPALKEHGEVHFDTLAVHGGVELEPVTGAVMTPIFQTSTYAQHDVGDHTGYEYSRTDNPTRTALQRSVAALEGGHYGLAFASGMAAIDNLMSTFSPGDHILCGNDVYGGTFRLFDKVLRRRGLEFSFIDTGDLDALRAALRPSTRLIWLETPTNPLLKLTDIAAAAQIAREAGVLLGVDNTFASPALQRPLELGADLVIHSTTKYIAGHSDVVGGVTIVNDEALWQELKFLQNSAGAVPGPMDCFLTLRGIKTLALRMERHVANATRLAHFLEAHPSVRQVVYPFLDSHPQKELAQRQMSGGGGIVSFVLKDAETARKVSNGTHLFTLAESLGGVESLIEVPAIMTHASVAESDLAVDPGLVRISAGIEAIEDLEADLSRALEAASKALPEPAPVATVSR
ncbi:MAG: cystathionine gamma-synthase [Acidobacteriota bacterium]